MMLLENKMYAALGFREKTASLLENNLKITENAYTKRCPSEVLPCRTILSYIYQGNYFRAPVIYTIQRRSYTILWYPFLALLRISWAGEIVVILVIVLIQDASFCTLCTVGWGNTLYRLRRL